MHCHGGTEEKSNEAALKLNFNVLMPRSLLSVLDIDHLE